MSHPADEWLNMRGVCAFFGCPKPLHQSTIYRWIANGVLPRPKKIGGINRWRKADLQAVFDQMVEAQQ